MTESVATTTNVMDQPLTPEQAGERRAQILQDADFQKRVAAQDPVAFAEHLRLWRIEHGLPPTPPPPATPEQVHEAMHDTDRLLDDARLATWERHIHMDDTARAQHRRGLATRQQHEDAVRMIEKMKADRAFGAKVLAGDLEAKEKWMRWGLVAAMQVAPDDFDWSKS